METVKENGVAVGKGLEKIALCLVAGCQFPQQTGDGDKVLFPVEFLRHGGTEFIVHCVGEEKGDAGQA